MKSGRLHRGNTSIAGKEYGFWNLCFSQPFLPEMGEIAMDISRCAHCKRLLVPVLSANGRTELLCFRCDEVDPLTTDVAKWAKSPLADDQAA